LSFATFGVNVSVLSARGLALKGHNKIDAYVSLSLSGPGSWKSKVQTDIRKTTGNCEWNQRCEFVVYGLDSVLTVTANHKTVLGTAECIGVIEFQLRQQYGKMAPMWFRLRKKGKANEDLATQKYRGELLLKFEFSNKLSTSMTSLNTVHGSSALSALKRKMHLGKKDDRDTVSMAAGLPSSYSKVFGRGSPQPTAGAGINFNSLQRNPRAATVSSDGGSELQQAGFDRSGLIVPPLKAQNSIGSSSDRMTPEQQQQQRKR
uniref:C2 domain-containing protein n=1 Tax=Anisakis simplex TaxID=6269 RepID=A0A0M3J1V2_ANISI